MYHAAVQNTSTGMLGVAIQDSPPPARIKSF